MLVLVAATIVYVGFVLDVSFVTVNSQTFARVLFSRNFAYAKFRENEIHAKSPKSHCPLLI